MDQQPVRRIEFSRVLLSLLFTLISPVLLAAGDLTLPADHTARYEIEKYGSHIGNMETHLKKQKNQVHYSSTTSAVGFAALFAGDDLKESSILSWYKSGNSSELRQQSFNARKGSSDKLNQDIYFHWEGSNQAEINGDYKSSPYQLSTSQLVWGKHMLPLLMSSDLKKSPERKRNKFVILDKGNLQKYIYTLMTIEPLELNGQAYDTRKFKLWRKGSSRVTYVWLSKEHDYLPLKVEQHKEGKLNLKMVLRDYNRA